VIVDDSISTCEATALNLWELLDRPACGKLIALVEFGRFTDTTRESRTRRPRQSGIRRPATLDCVARDGKLPVEVFEDATAG
jgi:hypothetical protein